MNLELVHSHQKYFLNKKYELDQVKSNMKLHEKVILKTPWLAQALVWNYTHSLHVNVNFALLNKPE